MKKIYDLTINSRGKAHPMNDGFFVETAKLVNGYDEDAYVIREFSDCSYRISKNNLEKPCIKEFLERKMDMERAHRLGGLRREKGMSQAELALASGVNISTLQKLESGANRLSGAQVQVVLKLAKALDTTVEFLCS